MDLSTGYDVSRSVADNTDDRSGSVLRPERRSHRQNAKNEDPTYKTKRTRNAAGDQICKHWSLLKDVN